MPVAAGAALADPDECTTAKFLSSWLLTLPNAYGSSSRCRGRSDQSALRGSESPSVMYTADQARACAGFPSLPPRAEERTPAAAAAHRPALSSCVQHNAPLELGVSFSLFARLFFEASLDKRKKRGKSTGCPSVLIDLELAQQGRGGHSFPGAAGPDERSSTSASWPGCAQLAVHWRFVICTERGK